jgi:hypothetical protein
VGVVNRIGLAELAGLGKLVMGFRTETAAERSWACYVSVLRTGSAGERPWAGYDPLHNSRIRGSNLQGDILLSIVLGCMRGTYQVQTGCNERVR